MPEHRVHGRPVTTLGLLCASLAVACSIPTVAAAKLGIASFHVSLSSQQAGAHADQTTSFFVSTDALGNPTGTVKDATLTLPPGMVADIQGIPRCPLATFEKYKCPSADQVGVLEPSVMVCRGAQQPLTAEALAGEAILSVANAAEFCPSEGEVTIGSGPDAEKAKIEYIETADNTVILGAPLEHDHAAGETVTHDAVWHSLPLPLFNLQPLAGHQATLAAGLLFANILVNVNLPRGGSGGVKATIEDATTLLGFKGATLTLWGVPSAASHDSLRCNELVEACDLPAGEPLPFATNPTDCGASVQATFEVSSYEGEQASAASTVPPMSGCDQLEASGELSVAPETTQRDTPTGYELDVAVPQRNQPEGLATPAIESLSSTLPVGTTISPGMASGLQACSEAQFTGEDCPSAAKIGTATLSTPLLAQALQGAVYIGEPTASEAYPLRLVLAGDETSIRLAGHAELDPASGQVTVVFTNLPPLPFSDLKLDLFGGTTAVLANPESCGPATSSAELVTYAGQTTTATSTFQVSATDGGGACGAMPAFAPTVAAGTTTPLAGALSPFTLTVARADGEPSLASFSAQLPPGLLGVLAAVPRCPEAQAALGDCPQDSTVGRATVLAGPGPAPLEVSGAVYLTGPYDGAPLGLDTVIDADAGPFDLGQAIVRGQIYVNPTNLQLTIDSGRLPQAMAGVPLRLKAVNIALSRAGLILNPTDCSAATTATTVDAIDGAEATVSSPFRVEGCEELPFAPRLTADTRAGAGPGGDGASLAVKIATPHPGSGTMRSAHIQLPTQLRARLSTLRHACLAHTALTSPSECPAESQVGSATIASQVLGAPLTGPVLLVAHGGTSLPSLVLLLHAEAIDVELTGALSMSRRGLLTTSFTALPDVPISTFDLTLASGPRSMLGAIENVCRTPLRMPYTLVDQSGSAMTGSARVGVGGCRARKASRPAAPRRPVDLSPAKTPTPYLHAAFSPDRLGSNTTITVGFRVWHVAAPLTSVEISLPRGLGAGLNGLGVATCSAMQLEAHGPGGCPTDALIGRGRAYISVPLGSERLLEPVQTSTFMAPAAGENTAMAVYARGTEPVIAQLVFQGSLLGAGGPFGAQLETLIPPLPGLPGAPGPALVSMQTQIRPKDLKYYRREHGVSVPYTPEGFAVPARCPRGGFPFAALFTFSDGAQESAATRVPCPAGAKA
jgi:hypothetical protein